MANYIVSYDLNGPTPTHAQMDEHIVANSILHARILETVWYVSSDLTTARLYNDLRSILRPEDRLLVVHGASAAWENLLVDDATVLKAWEANR